MRALAFLLGLLATQAPAAAGQQDTVRFGDRVRINAPALRVQTARFLEVDADSVRLVLSHGTEAKVGRAGARLELARGRDRAKGFRRGALVGGLVGAALTGLAVAAFANCGECDSDGGFDPAVAALIVGTPAAAFGVLGLLGAPTRWRPAALPAPASPDGALPPPDLGTLRVWAVAGSQAKASQFGDAWERQRAGESRLEPVIRVDDARAGPSEVVYGDPGDAPEATLLAFWLRRTLQLSAVATRLERRPAGPRVIEVWLGS